MNTVSIIKSIKGSNMNKTCKGINKKGLTCVVFAIIFTVFAALQSACQRATYPDIIVSGFAQYDWVREILGNNPSNLEVKYLLDNGIDLHNYIPSVQDIAAIGSCSLFIYTDSDSEKWISNALKNPANPARKTLNLISLLSKDEKIALDEDSGHVHTEDCTHEYDEHIWLSLRLAQTMVSTIANRLGEIDPENAEAYSLNAQQYLTKLTNADEEFMQTLEGKTERKLLIADRYPFAYLMRDYSIEVCAAFSGCAADTEMSVQKLAELKNYLAQNSLKYVLIMENSSGDIASQVVSGTTAQIKTLNSMQSITANQLGLSYLSIMQSNLEVLNLALS